MKVRRSVTPGRFAASSVVQGLALLVVLAACESPHPPAACNPLPGHTLHVGESATAPVCFEDPNEADSLTYSVASSDPGVATATLSGTTVTVMAAVPGFATITITATDPEGLEGHARFTVTVPNRAPVATGTIESLTIDVGATATIDVSSYFSEPDGQTLTYSAASSDADVASVITNQQIIIVSSQAHGTALITVTATDPGGLTAAQSFTVTVPNRGPETRGQIPAATIVAGTTVTIDMSPYFSDPDGDPLTYSATNSDPAVIAVTAVFEAVIVSSLARGTADVTVTVTDPGGLTATQSFTVTVPNRSPEVVGAIPPASLHVGDTLMLDLSSYFSDPDGDALDFAATTADATITASAGAGGVVTLAGLARGTGTVMVTVTDPGGLTASQSFRVDIPNRPPRAGLNLPAFDLSVGYPAEHNAAPHFSDPDGDPLTYSATTSNTGVATASVSGSIVTVTPVAPGTATLTVTASDPEGLEVTQDGEITVRPPDPGYFADDFATSASLRNWTVTNASGRIRDGVLNLTNSRRDRRGMAYRNHAVTEWSLTARLGRADTTAAAALVMSMDHARYTHYIVQIGSGVDVDGQDTNFRFLLYDADDDSYFHPPGLQGKSTLIRDDSGEFTDITFSLVNRQLVLRSGTTELFRSFPLDTSLPVETTGYAMVPWPLDDRPGRTVLFDWLEMDGDLVGGSAQSRQSDAGESILRLPPDAGTDGIRTKRVPGLRVAPPGG
ncbi:MAG: hypothetical protein F4123_13760 [Gemmatimonadetes bacterium]|nr:hypothetical protein [Gemmatimonadota bacterium]MYB98900.1 hypothetical protein [Gemmatimonadota bacterium]MYI47420.1 hypothetical protein [Gemmatimonadota bacterium]